MQHTNLVSGKSGGQRKKVLRKAAADTGDSAVRDSGVESSHIQSERANPNANVQPRDLSLLVNQLYAQIKRELQIERERRGGLY